MRLACIFIAINFYSVVHAQFTVVPLGTTENLRTVVSYSDTVIVAGTKTFLSRSIDGGNVFLPLAMPAFTASNYFTEFTSLNSRHFFLGANSTTNNYTIWKSSTAGQSWIKLLDTTGFNLQPIFTRFFDTADAVSICNNSKTILSSGSFGTYTIGSWPNQLPGYAAGANGDSTIIFSVLSGGAYLSRNRGASWTGTSGMNLPANCFHFFSKDTVFAVANYLPNSYESCFLKSFDGGLNWQCVSFTGSTPPNGSQPDEYFGAVFAKKGNRIYIVGRNGLTSSGHKGFGVILSSNDSGMSWQRYITPFKEDLNGIQFVNDSIAFICGSNGLLFKLNTLSPFFTTIKEDEKSRSLEFFPNPTSNIFYPSISSEITDTSVMLIDLTGRIVKQIEILDKNGIEIGELSDGLYYLIFKENGVPRIYKIVKASEK